MERALAKSVSLHSHDIEQTTEVIVEYSCCSVKHRLGGRAKAVIVTSLCLHAVRYKLAFKRYLKENDGFQHIRPLIAFRDMVRDPETGVAHTEPN